MTGIRAERELPVVWAVAKGSALNKLMLVPTALAISALAPWAITPLLMLGGAFLCYEGAHKVLHAAKGDDHDHDVPAAVKGPQAEQQTISGVNTDEEAIDRITGKLPLL